MVSSRSTTDSSTTDPKNDAHSWFGVRTCQSMLETLLCLTDIDVDILLLLRDEVYFSIIYKLRGIIKMMLLRITPDSKFIQFIFRCSLNLTALSTHW